MPIINQEIESIDDFKNILNSAKTSKQVVVLKFTANWCKPCKIAKPFIDAEISNMSKNILFYSIDIDEQLDIYIKLKSKKMLNGIPSLIAWYPNNKNIETEWYIVDNSISGSNQIEIKQFFNDCNIFANK